MLDVENLLKFTKSNVVTAIKQITAFPNDKSKTLAAFQMVDKRTVAALPSKEDVPEDAQAALLNHLLLIIHAQSLEIKRLEQNDSSIKKAKEDKSPPGDPTLNEFDVTKLLEQILQGRPKSIVSKSLKMVGVLHGKHIQPIRSNTAAIAPVIRPKLEKVKAVAKPRPKKVRTKKYDELDLLRKEKVKVIKHSDAAERSSLLEELRKIESDLKEERKKEPTKVESSESSSSESNPRKEKISENW